MPQQTFSVFSKLTATMQTRNMLFAIAARDPGNMKPSRRLASPYTPQSCLVECSLEKLPLPRPGSNVQNSKTANDCVANLRLGAFLVSTALGNPVVRWRARRASGSGQQTVILRWLWFWACSPRSSTQTWERLILVISIRTNSSWASQFPEILLLFTSTCPVKVQISRGLGPFLQIEPWTTGCIFLAPLRYAPTSIHIYIYIYMCVYHSNYIIIHASVCSRPLRYAPTSDIMSITTIGGISSWLSTSSYFDYVYHY